MVYLKKKTLVNLQNIVKIDTIRAYSRILKRRSDFSFHERVELREDFFGDKNEMLVLTAKYGNFIAAYCCFDI